MASGYQNVDLHNATMGDGRDEDLETSIMMSATESENTVGTYTTQPTIVVPDRPAFNQVEFNANYQMIPPQRSGCKERIENLLKKCSTTEFWWSFAKSRLPILVWLPQYQWKADILNDVIAGITVAIMHVSLGMAFALLALMPPITGLYIAFFSNLIYTFIGSAHHIALCGTAVISIMIGEVVQRLLHPPDPSIPFTSLPVIKNSSLAKLLPTSAVSTVSLMPNTVSLNVYEGVTAVDIAIAITLVAGIIHMITGVLRLGGLSVYLSDTMLSGFLAGTTCHVFTSQLATLFGVTIPQIGSPLKVFKTIIAVCARLPHANVATVITSASTIVLLVLLKFLSGRYLKEVVPFTIPLELIAILVGTLISYYLKFEGEYGVAIVGYIQTGLPSPAVPALWIIPNVLLDSIIICIVAYTITLSFGLVFAKKYGFKVDSNQELLALGFINICSSFFHCIPCCVGMSRTMAQEEAGSRTLLTNFIASIILLFAILYIGPIFHDLPMCILAAIVLIALTGMFSEIKLLRKVWAISIVEASLWMVAFIAVVSLDVGIGLGIGFLYSLVVTVVRTQWPYTFLLGKIPGTDMYLDITKYQAAEEIPGIKIYHFASFLYFVNKDYFVSELNRLTGFDTIQPGTATSPKFWTSSPLRRETLLINPKAKESPSYGSTMIEPNMSESVTPTPTTQSTPRSMTAPVHHVIIDASGWSYIDLPGIDALNQVVDDYKKKGITIFIAGCQAQVSEKLVHSEFILRGNKHLIFPTIQDAMAYAELEGREYTNENWSRTDV